MKQNSFCLKKPYKMGPFLHYRIDVTDVSFIVHHNGNVLTAVEVSKRLFSPKTSDVLASHLQAKNLKQYRSSPTTVSTQKDNVKVRRLPQ